MKVNHPPFVATGYWEEWDMSEQAICFVCGQPAGPLEDFAGARVSHGACALEVCYIGRGVDPASCEYYAEACIKRMEQVGGCGGNLRAPTTAVCPGNSRVG